jgi:hypothetical protein
LTQLSVSSSLTIFYINRFFKEAYENKIPNGKDAFLF